MIYRYKIDCIKRLFNRAYKLCSSYAFLSLDKNWKVGLQQIVQTYYRVDIFLRLIKHEMQTSDGKLIHQENVCLWISSKKYQNCARIKYQTQHTEKSFRNLIKSNRNQIVFTIFRLISDSPEPVFLPLRKCCIYLKCSYSSLCTYVVLLININKFIGIQNLCGCKMLFKMFACDYLLWT